MFSYRSISFLYRILYGPSLTPPRFPSAQPPPPTLRCRRIADTQVVEVAPATSLAPAVRDAILRDAVRAVSVSVIVGLDWIVVFAV